MQNWTSPPDSGWCGSHLFAWASSFGFNLNILNLNGLLFAAVNPITLTGLKNLSIDELGFERDAHSE
jgi:hypothetical protein